MNNVVVVKVKLECIMLAIKIPNETKIMGRKQNRILNFRYAIFVFLLGYASVSQSNSYFKYIPIAVDDITIFVPIFNTDADGDGNPDFNDPDVSPEEVFSAFSAALMSGDIESAVKFISVEKRNQYEQAFLDLGSDASSVISGISNTAIIFSGDTLMEIAVTRSVNGTLESYIVTIVKNRDEVWRIAHM